MTNKAALLSSLTILVLVVLGCGRLSELSNDKIKTDDKGSGSFALAGKEWKSYDLENTDIKVELPGAPSDNPTASTVNFNASTFGRITTQAGVPRILQFGVKYDF